MILRNSALFCFFLFISVLSNAQCFQDRHNTSQDEAWLSCAASESPNVERGVSHWIMYDLGVTHGLGESVLWNYNTPGFESNGIQELAIDYSLDGTTWETYGTYDFQETSASSFNEGTTGPDLSGVNARFVLLTALSNFGGDCFGFAEIKIGLNDVVSSVSENAKKDFSFAVSPNPASEILKLKFDSKHTLDCTLRLTNSLGQNVLSKQLTISEGQSNHEFDINTFNSGVYLIHIQYRTNISSTELIITK